MKFHIEFQFKLDIFKQNLDLNYFPFEANICSNLFKFQNMGKMTREISKAK